MTHSNNQTENILWQSNIDPTCFFHEKVVEAQEKNKIKLSENVEFYLINLLCDQIRTSDSTNSNENCLVLILKKALESSFEEKILLYKKLADTALYFAGFFQEYFNNKSFDIKYYVTMGESAYKELSNLMRGPSTYRSTMSQIYREMSDSFLNSVDILLHISEQSYKKSYERNLLSIYNAWLNTSSNKLQNDLFLKGIHPIKINFRQIQ